MDWIEVSARTVEDAKELALDRLGVVEDELEYEVLDEAKNGLFGLRRGDARIRARVKPLSRDKPVDRRRRRGPARGERPARGSRTGGSSGGGGGDRKSSGGGGGRPPKTTTSAAATDGSPNAARPSSGNSRNRRRGRGRSGEARTETAAPAREADNGKAEVENVESVPVATQADDAAKFTEQLVRTMGFPASVRTEIDDEDITVHIEGDGLGTLVGPKGVTLHALEEVVRAVVQHRAGGHSAWVHVDVGGYRQRRREALEAFALKVAGEVKDEGEARSLEPMSAADRKVVHDALSELDGVATGSEGEEPRRRVVIRPA